MSVDIIQLLVGGILLGGIYGLAAFGLSISFGVLNILNLAHGEFLMLGSLVSYSAFVLLGINPFVSAVLVIPLFVVFGVGFYLLLLKPVSDKPPHQLLVASILVTLGISLAIEDLTAFFWERPVTGIAYSLPAIELGHVVISSLRLSILLFICVLAVLLQAYLKRTFVGRAIRAITQSREGAKIVGVPIAHISGFTFGLGVALAASAGVFYVTLFTVTPVIGIPLTVKYLCVVVLGGLGSLVGSVVGGLILGLSEVLTAYYFGAEWSPCIAFVLLISILIIRPSGLFGIEG
ncbi:MAG: branched-chain amino acid ABC transporter permease [Deltaproteobacteria bacterium]